MTKMSQDSFIVGKSKFRQCLSPPCFYAAYKEHNWCRKHMIEEFGEHMVEPIKKPVTEKVSKPLG
jgi:hypothetical protein